MTMRSALYVGSVMHRRLKPREHRFRYRAFWCLFDLDELPALSLRLFWFSHNRANLFSLRDQDHGDGSGTPLRTQSVYFCHDAGGRLAARVYQVHNTFGERHSYVIPVTPENNAPHQHCSKDFYVSPFLDMDLRYDFRVSGPDQRINVGICVSAAGAPVMSAVLAAN